MDPGRTPRVRRLIMLATAGMIGLAAEGVLIALVWTGAKSHVRSWLIVGLIVSLALTFVPLSVLQGMIWKQRKGSHS